MSATRERTFSRVTVRTSTLTSRPSMGFGTLSQDQRKPFFSQFRLDAGHLLLLQLRRQPLRLSADQVEQAVLGRLLRPGALHLAARLRRVATTSFMTHRQPWPARLGPQAQLRVHAVGRIAFRPGRTFCKRHGGCGGRVAGGWQINSTTTIQSGLPFTPSYRDCGTDRDAGPCRPDVVGDVRVNGDQNNWFDTTPIGAPGSPFARPAVGHFGNIGRNTLPGPVTGELMPRCSSISGHGRNAIAVPR